MSPHLSWALPLSCSAALHRSVFDGMVIPYPKRKFLSDDDNSKDEKADINKVTSAQ